MGFRVFFSPYYGKMLVRGANSSQFLSFHCGTMDSWSNGLPQTVCIIDGITFYCALEFSPLE